LKTRRQPSKIAERFPWITKLNKSRACEGFMSNTHLKAVYEMHGKPPVGLDNYCCKNPARWKFKALKRSMSRDGVFCYSHLLSNMDMTEHERAQKWLERNPL
jgi:hypothetical protein